MTSEEIKTHLDATPRHLWPSVLLTYYKAAKAEAGDLLRDMAQARTNLALVQLRELENQIGTQGEVAERIGVTSGYLTHVRKGRRLVSAGMAKRINDMLRTMRDA